MHALDKLANQVCSIVINVVLVHHAIVDKLEVHLLSNHSSAICACGCCVARV